MPKSNEVNAWEQQKGESAQAFEAFSLYLNMGKERSLRKVEQELNKSHALIGRWSSKYHWSDRVREYTNYLRKQEVEEARKAVKDMQKRQVQTALLMQKKAIKALEKLDIDSLSPKYILQFIAEGSKIERETRKETVNLTEEEAGTKTNSSLADTIAAAYARRKESEGE